MGGKIIVIGVGTMGCGIAQVALAAGYDVVLMSHSEQSVKKGLGLLKLNLDKAVAKARMTAEQENSCMARLKGSWEMNDLKDAYLIVEAVPEDLKTKLDVLSNIDRYADQSTIIATNTSSIPISSLAVGLRDPSRLIGLHFFNPVPVMKLVEVVRGAKTSDIALQTARKFGEDVGKTAVDVKDSPGFISNRILMVYINEAVKSYQDGVATKEGIDTIAKLGFNHPMGPLELADLIGLDVCQNIMDAIYNETKNENFIPAPMLKKLVMEGRLGRKTGEGFYKYK